MANILLMRELDPELPVLFTHVPKTGGSAVTIGMAQIVGRENIAGISTASPDKRREFLQRCRAEGKRYVYGHFHFRDAVGIYDEANFIVSLRHPLDRVLSFYFMLLRNDPRSALAAECLDDISGKGFTRFHDWMIRRRRQDNLMCRYICGEPDHRSAIENLERRYALAWNTQSMDLAWRELHLALAGSEPKQQELRRRNHAPVADGAQDLSAGARPKDYATFLTPENKELVAAQNAEDILLFEWFQNQAESGAKRYAAAG